MMRETVGRPMEILLVEDDLEDAGLTIEALRRSGSRTMTVRDDAQRRFIAEVQERLSRSVPAQDNCLTYFKTAGGRITTQWPGYAMEYRWRTRSVRTSDYEFG